MKGLLYKDCLLALPTIIVYGSIQLVLSIITVILAFWGRNDDDAVAALSIISVICCFLIYFMLTMIPVTFFSTDATHAWQNFAAASPLGPTGQVGSKYLILLACNIAVFIVHALQFVVLSLITETDLYFLILIDLVLMSASIIMSSLELPFYFTFGLEKGQSIKGVSLMIVIFFAAAYLFFGDISFFDSPYPLAVLLSIITGSAILFIPIGIVLISFPLYCLSMMLSIKLFTIGLDNLEQ